MCPDIPVLERLMADIGGLAESGARYTEMPHVIEITLPMLCSYLPRWWERGPEAPPPALPAGAPHPAQPSPPTTSTRCWGISCESLSTTWALTRPPG